MGTGEKKRLIFFAYLILIFSGSELPAQTFTDSNLPIILITTDNLIPIVDDPRVLATMKIIFRGEGQRNYLTDQNNTAYLNYNGRIDIEIRGSSSQTEPKKQYGFTTRMADNISNNNVSLLGMPSEHDWILNGMVFDPALIRDYLCYNLSRHIGEYASRTAYCELMINGSYKGLYLLQEKIKADENRVDIIKITPEDNLLPDLSGGYITKADKTTGGDPVAWKMFMWTGATVDYMHELPKPEDVTPEQNTYIKSQFEKLEATLWYNNESPADGFPSVIDVPSFINYILLSELSSNADAYQFSTYFHKDRNGKLRAGPVWDNDLTFGNDLFQWGFDRSKTDVWQLSNGNNDGSQFWKDLFEQTRFRCYLSKRWYELTQPGQPFNISSTQSLIDQTAALISEAVIRDNTLWSNTGILQNQITNIRIWLDRRITWINANIGTYSGCSNVTVPDLVISRIMYNPEESADFPDGDDLEFIEIKNNGAQIADLTGIYFAGTGLVYQFPAGSELDPSESVYLAGNAKAFLKKYGFFPFGRFTRSLSNKSEDLTLCDAFGNVIDKVVYSDTIPWPDADGNGYYLELIDPELDNSIPQSWTASDNYSLSAEGGISAAFKLYPNPVADYLYIESDYEILNISISDINGRILSREEVNSFSYRFDMRNFPGGFYLIKITASGQDRIFRIIKI
jgi:hypothetical protein